MTTMTVARRRQALVPWGLVGALATVLVLVAGNVRVDHAAGEKGGPADALITGLVCLVLGALLFGLVLPRVQRPERVAPVLATLAVLTIVVFWSGVPVVLGASTAALGFSTSRRAGRVSAWVAVAVMAVVVVWSLVQHLV